MGQRQIKVILNPYAGSWKPRQLVGSLIQQFAQCGIEVDLVMTQSPGEATELARAAVECGFQGIVVVGGDGTVSEVVNGLMQASTDEAQIGPLGIIPLGTANDLADMLHLPRRLKDACQRIALGNLHLIDVCQVNDHFFVNNSAVGLEALVTRRSEDIRFIQGKLRYLVAAFLTIWSQPAWHAFIEWDTGTYRGPIAMVSVGNSPRTGGAFWLTPKAKLDDGKLDFVYAPALKRFSLLRLLPQALTGKHIDHNMVVYLQSKALKVTIEPTLAQADGELLAPDITHLEYRVWPQKLKVIV